MPKRKEHKAEKVYDFYSDPSHGWLKVSRHRLHFYAHRPSDFSEYSYWKDGHAYLEEDRDAVIFLRTLEEKGAKYALREHDYQGPSPIRNYRRIGPHWKHWPTDEVKDG